MPGWPKPATRTAMARPRRASWLTSVTPWGSPRLLWRVRCLREAVAPILGINLAACLLLAGGLKPSPLVAQTGGSVLDLYLRSDATVLSLWLDRFEELGSPAPGPVIHIAHGASTPAPNDMLARRRGFRLRIEEDRQEF